jgi:hypothetical protein
MNHYQDECTAEYNRQRIKDEIKQIRSEQLALEEGMIFSSSKFTREITNATNGHGSCAQSNR